MLVTQIQEEATRFGFDGWLLVDFRGSNPIFTDLAGLSGIVTRRCALWIPSVGEPRLFGSAVDGHTITRAPWPSSLYRGVADFQRQLLEVLVRARVLAMEFTPRGENPPISRVDAGFVDWLREHGKDVRSSGNLISALVRWDEDQMHLHREAAAVVDNVRAAAFSAALDAGYTGKSLAEHELAATIVADFKEAGLINGATDVAVNAHAADPHYSASPVYPCPIIRGDLLLIDLWAKRNDPRAPFADSTWVGFLGGRAEVPPEIQLRFDVLRRARDRGLETIYQAFTQGRILHGREVDQSVRKAITDAGFAAEIAHRTGHSLGWHHIHGDGPNFDDIEFPDDRIVQVGSGVTIEPGLYTAGRFGIRLEISLIVTAHGPEVTTALQDQLVTFDSPP
ncbi:MAG: M24 family metallopeptidase [Chloroflexi bacterium]|nr:M24 family metallopeptidase [Chloroflexota bacterium]